MKIEPRIKVMLKIGETTFGPGACHLLEIINEAGSLSQACEMMNLSYTKGRKIINKLESQLEEKLVIRRVGGAHGGGCELTDVAHELIRNYRSLEKETKEYNDHKFNEIFKKDL